MSSSFPMSSPARAAGHPALHAGLPTQLPSLRTGGANGHDAGAAPVLRDDGQGAPAAPGDQQLSIAVADWDVMFDAVQARLIHSVGERLGQLPDVPQHSAELSASLVQAVVLDCVNALNQLHAALRQERSQRPTS